MKITKVVFLTSASTVVKLLSSVVINKFVSLFIGPSGLAVIGHFQNISGIIQTFAIAGLTNGVVKYTADTQSRNSLWSTALKVTIIMSLLCGCVLVVFSSQLASYFLEDNKYRYVFILYGFTVTLFSVNQLLLAILSGLKRINLYIKINIIQSLYSLIFTAILVYLFRLDGALIAMVTNQSVILFVLFWFLRNDKEIILTYFFSRFDYQCLKKLLRYTLMSIISVISLPISAITIRNYVGNHLSWDYAGYWQAVNYISSMYLLVITTVLSVYYLPRLSEIKNKNALIKEMINNSIVLLPLTILGAAFIYLIKDWIVLILFSKDFSNMLILFKYQLIGDVIKISACLLSYLMLAKAITKTFIFTEVLSALSLTFLSIFSLKYYGFVGLSYAYLANNLLYLVIMIVVNIWYFKYNKDI
ncbi:O-antigen translocase [Serratia aquatilis]|uniref:O-antigen translocase n=1 Tax=Serratia aquatilis TaxID=1737515 RepID=A0ABV6EJU7_9GAMM